MLPPTRNHTFQNQTNSCNPLVKADWVTFWHEITRPLASACKDELKTYLPCRRNAMFSKKLASRLDKTPTFETHHLSQNLEGQKKTSKTQGKSMFFLPSKKQSLQLGNPAYTKKTKVVVFPNETLTFSSKVKKTQCFSLLFEALPRRTNAYTFVTDWSVHRFFCGRKTLQLRFQIARNEIGIGARSFCLGPKWFLKRRR